MDRKGFLILLSAVALLIVWHIWIDQTFPRRPLPVGTNAITGVVTNGPGTVSELPPTTAVASGSTNGLVTPQPPVEEKTLTITNELAVYRFTSRGGGLQMVELRGFPEVIPCGKKVPATTNFAMLNSEGKNPVLAFAAAALATTDDSFQLSAAPGGVIAERTFPGGLLLRKTFLIESNYTIAATVRFENQTTQSVLLPQHEFIGGTAAPVSTNDNGQSVGVFWYNGSKAEHVQEGWFENRTLGCFSGTPRAEYSGGLNNVGWAAPHNQFFTLIVASTNPAQNIVIRRGTLATSGTTSGPPRGLQQHTYEAALVYPARTIAAGQTIEHRFSLYAGPRKYDTLARMGDQQKNNVDLVMDFGQFFGIFAKALLLSMNGLHKLGLTYGLAIVVITIIIKLLFWPLTKASTRSMKRMQKLQPQIKEIQEKYKEDPRKMQGKMAELWKEHKVNPVSGCLPIIVQIPVFIGFYQMLQSAIELRGARFLWACDLSAPDTVFSIAGFPINPLPIIMGVTMLWQAKLTPPSPGMDPMQQKIMKYMPLMFMVFLYNMSAGLTLYWTVQNALTIAQMKLTKTEDEPAAGKPGTPPQRPTPPYRPPGKRKK